MLTENALRIAQLGPCHHLSPLRLARGEDVRMPSYVSDSSRVRLQVEYTEGQVVEEDLAFEKAGPREQLYFIPEKTRVALVTCGGLCPGTNVVIRSAVQELHHKYRVKDVIGYSYGFRGMSPHRGMAHVNLTLDAVRDIHRQGGSILGTSRGSEEAKALVDRLQRDDVQVLMCIGGDGTQRGAHAIYEEITRRGLSISVVGVPKTIDNDLAFVDKTFGFDTAVEMASIAIDAAHTEARSALNGVGLVKLMGRDAGFIAAAASLASREVNFCLVPEIDWSFEGLLSALVHRLAERPHAVIVIAEGCGRMLVDENTERDASGNVRYGSDEADIGLRVRDAITGYFKERKLPLTLKYIDPSYMIRGVPANATDSIFCDSLARSAVHAGMAGKTDLVIGRWNGVLTHVPIPIATGERKRVDPNGSLWLAVTEATGQALLVTSRDGA